MKAIFALCLVVAVIGMAMAYVNRDDDSAHHHHGGIFDGLAKGADAIGDGIRGFAKGVFTG